MPGSNTEEPTWVGTAGITTPEGQVAHYHSTAEMLLETDTKFLYFELDIFIIVSFLL